MYTHHLCKLTNYSGAFHGGRAICSKGNIQEFSLEVGRKGNIIGLSGGCSGHSATNWEPKFRWI